MLWRQLEGKDIINLHDGDRIGMIADAELVIDEEDGSIIELRMRGGGAFGLFGTGVGEMVIPWDAVKKIGPQVVIVDMEVSQSTGQRGPGA